MPQSEHVSRVIRARIRAHAWPVCLIAASLALACGESEHAIRAGTHAGSSGSAGTSNELASAASGASGHGGVDSGGGGSSPGGAAARAGDAGEGNRTSIGGNAARAGDAGEESATSVGGNAARAGAPGGGLGGSGGAGGAGAGNAARAGVGGSSPIQCQPPPPQNTDPRCSGVGAAAGMGGASTCPELGLICYSSKPLGDPCYQGWWVDLHLCCDEGWVTSGGPGGPNPVTCLEANQDAQCPRTFLQVACTNEGLVCSYRSSASSSPLQGICCDGQWRYATCTDPAACSCP